ncbi:MAG: hypothetical protein OQJ99_03940 [Rhodospirillales bacterium]|nr:hypothetical protein [Rhodospirillales bacterium]MCW8862639.1 hypothetical protein [Rhodospirillales bacterium]MCW8951243.1 hypothetical protein [Rhodospirillales bacterium]MCW8970672.1 hypothetical protein [Rhodospirillales bacterium]MCW9002018.1 hypothetical protein [Rhodospirillales bacterium]
MIKRIVTIIICTVGLSACYLPAKFDADIEIARNGFYKIDFAGYLARVPLYSKLHKNELSPAEEKEQVDIILRDLKRDESVVEASYYQKGHFKVVYKKQGDLLQSKMITILRRNEDLISLTFSKKNGTITVRGNHVRKQDANRLADMGLWMEGVLRLKTDAAVVSNNATTIKKGEGREQLLIWEIKGPFDPAPKAVLALR